MAWIELHQSLPTHRKTLALCDALNIKPAQAVGHLVCLWLWAVDNAPDGAVIGVSARTLARAGQWERSADAFMEGLRTAGFLDQDGVIHDWTDYTGKLMEQRQLRRESNRKAQSARRQRTRHADSHQVVSADEADNQQSTGPDPTGPDRTVVAVASPGAREVGRRRRSPENLPDEVRRTLEAPSIEERLNGRAV